MISINHYDDDDVMMEWFQDMWGLNGGRRNHLSAAASLSASEYKM